MPQTRDQYRCMSDDALLEEARYRGIDGEMAVVLAERLERSQNRYFPNLNDGPSMGGRYFFNHRSDECTK